MAAAPTLHSPLSYRQRAELFTQLAQMEIAGLPFDKAFALLEMPPPATSRLAEAKKLTARGIDPAKAGERSGLFTRLDAKLVRAALNAGSPAGMYRRLGDVYTERALQLASMRSKMMMPLMVLGAALFIQPLPAFIGGGISEGGYLWKILRPVLFLSLLYYGLRWVWRHVVIHGENSALGAALLQIPVAGPLIMRTNRRDFFESLALMLEAGVSMLDALPAAIETLQVATMRESFSVIAPRIAAGADLTTALAGVNYLSNDRSAGRLVEFVRSGEASGTLPEMLLRHTRMETEAINQTWQQVAEWAPRILYGCIALWMAMGILTSGAFLPQMPKDL